MKSRTALGILAILVLGCPMIFVWSTFASDPRVGGPLQSDLRQAVALTDALVAAAGPQANVMPSPFNADLEQAETLRDNHSVEDHGVGPVTVGDLFANRFEDCDSWRNVFSDGWTTRYRIIIDLPTEQAARRLLPKARAA